MSRRVCRGSNRYSLKSRDLRKVQTNGVGDVPDSAAGFTREGASLLVVCVLISGSIGIVLPLLPIGSGLAPLVFHGILTRLSVPLFYVIFAYWLISRRRYFGGGPRSALIDVLLALVVISTIAALLVPRQAVLLNELLEGGVLLLGFALFAQAGLRAKSWGRGDLVRLLTTVALAGALASGLHSSLGPFESARIPAAFGLLLLALTGGAGLQRVGLVLVAVVPAIPMALQLNAAGDAARGSTILQILACLVVLVICVVPLFVRRTVLVGGVLGLLVLLVVSTPPLVLWMLGSPVGAEGDVTILHRVYEVNVVYGMMGEDPLSLLVGLGPGGTIDLEGSPDRATLVNVGRNLAAVGDVHFLIGWIALKLGILGLIWLCLLCLQVFGFLWQFAGERVDPVNAVFLMLLLAGIGEALPAGNHFLNMPMVAFSFGVLYARLVVPRSSR